MDNKYNNISWNEESYAVFVSNLKELTDEGYRKFHSNLVPNIDNILGIRVPILRGIGKDISRGDWREYFQVCKDSYYEETILQGFVLNNVKTDLDETIKYMDKFIIKIDNWATCDTFCSGMKIIKKNMGFFYPYIQKLLSSKKEYSIRTGLVLLLAHYINEEYIDNIYTISNSVENDSYYVKMANAWLIATCFSKFRDKTMSFLENNRLDKWTHNKSIQKIIESKTTTDDEKAVLRKLKK